MGTFKRATIPSPPVIPCGGVGWTVGADRTIAADRSARARGSARPTATARCHRLAECPPWIDRPIALREAIPHDTGSDDRRNPWGIVARDLRRHTRMKRILCGPRRNDHTNTNAQQGVNLAVTPWPFTDLQQPHAEIAWQLPLQNVDPSNPGADRARFILGRVHAPGGGLFGVRQSVVQPACATGSTADPGVLDTERRRSCDLARRATGRVPLGQDDMPIASRRSGRPGERAPTRQGTAPPRPPTPPRRQHPQARRNRAILPRIPVLVERSRRASARAAGREFGPPGCCARSSAG